MSYAPDYIRENYEEIVPHVFSGVPNEVYHSDEAISNSNIKDINISLDLFFHRQQYREPTDSMIIGSAFHDLVLLPDEYHKNYIVSPYRTKTAKGYKSFVEENSDRIVLKPQDADNLFIMRDNLMKNPTISRILTSDTTMNEVSIWAVDPITEINLKIRPDIVCDGIIYDLKTTSGSVEPRGAIQSVYKFKYHIQAAFYTAVANLVGLKIREFVFMFIETSPPYHTALYNLNDELLQEGEDIIRRALDRYYQYMTGEDDWSGLEHGKEIVTL